jgi:hypothetical protein
MDFRASPAEQSLPSCPGWSSFALQPLRNQPVLEAGGGGRHPCLSINTKLIQENYVKLMSPLNEECRTATTPSAGLTSPPASASRGGLKMAASVTQSKYTAAVEPLTPAVQGSPSVTTNPLKPESHRLPGVCLSSSQCHAVVSKRTLPHPSPLHRDLGSIPHPAIPHHRH